MIVFLLSISWRWPCCHPLGNGLLKKCFCSENRSPTGLVSFNMQNPLSPSSERWRTVHRLCLLCWLGVWGCAEAIYQISMLTLARLSFFFPSLRSVSQPCPHYPFLSSVMVQGLLNILSPRTKFRKCGLSPGPSLMTASRSHCADTGIQSPWLFRVPTQRIVKEELLLRHIILIHMWACSCICMS